MPSAADNDYPVISCICISLGLIAGASFILSVYDADHRPFWIFSLSLPIFHFLEFFITIIHHPQKHSPEGLTMVIVGQLVRSKAMQEAGKSFTHQIAEFREAHHHFVQSGLYAIMRHPSYFGFWMWSMGLTLVLGNPTSFLAFAIILHRFFSERIAEEEKLLVTFFPSHYPSYRRRVWSGIPFVK